MSCLASLKAAGAAVSVYVICTPASPRAWLALARLHNTAHVETRVLEHMRSRAHLRGLCSAAENNKHREDGQDYARSHADANDNY